MLDTTWDLPPAIRQVSTRAEGWHAWYRDHGSATIDGPGRDNARSLGCRAVGSVVRRGESVHLLAHLNDAQMVFLAIGPSGRDDELGAPSGRIARENGTGIGVHPADAAVIDRFCGRWVRPTRRGRSAPRRAWDRHAHDPGVAGHLRLHGADRLRTQRRAELSAGAQPAVQHVGGPGAEAQPRLLLQEVESGYTGSTFEGLRVAGTLAALLHPRPLA